MNVETGLRSALAAALAFLWISFGPFSGGLSFFAAVPSIACLGRTAGQTIGTFLVSETLLFFRVKPTIRQEKDGASSARTLRRHRRRDPGYSKGIGSADDPYLLTRESREISDWVITAKEGISL